MLPFALRKCRLDPAAVCGDTGGCDGVDYLLHDCPCVFAGDVVAVMQNKTLTLEEVYGDEWTDKIKKLARLIRGYRVRENMSQIDLAKALRGVKQSNISAWENGKEKVPEKRIKQLSKLFKTDLSKI